VTWVDPWRGVGFDPLNPFASMPEVIRDAALRHSETAQSGAIVTQSSDLVRIAVAANACPSRYRESCGCAEPFRCVVLYGSRVTLEDCVRCLKA
jgi:hypothetical protein